MTLDIPRILEELRRSSLLDADRLGSATIRECATSTDPEVLRAALQSFGIFTSFQIERIVSDRIDTLVVGRSIISEPLSDRSGMESFRAFDRSTRQPGILRRLPLESLGETSLGSWRAAAKIAVQQRHPHLISVLEVSPPDESPWIVHEYAEGVDVQTLVGEMGAIPPHMVLAFIRPVIEGLAMIHADGLCHGHISPSELVLSPVQIVASGTGTGATKSYRPIPGSVFRLDSLGLSIDLPALMDATIGDSERLGDLAFAAPERLTVAGYTPAMDVYSLGACLYFLLTTKAPVEGRTLVDVLMELQQQLSPKPIELIRSDIPSSLTDTIRQMLSRDPADRPTAAQIVARLRQPAPVPRQNPPTAMETSTHLSRFAPSVPYATTTMSGLDLGPESHGGFQVVPHVEPLDSGLLAPKVEPIVESLSAWELRGVAHPQVESLPEGIHAVDADAAAGPNIYEDAPGEDTSSVRIAKRKEKMGRYYIMAVAGLLLNGIALALALQFLILPGCRTPSTVQEVVPKTTKAKDKPRKLPS